MKRNLALGKKVSNLAKSNYVTDGDTEQYDGKIGFGECTWPCDVILDLEDFGVNPIDCTKCDRVLDRINTPRGEKGSCHEIQEVHSGI